MPGNKKNDFVVQRTFHVPEINKMRREVDGVRRKTETMETSPARLVICHLDCLLYWKVLTTFKCKNVKCEFDN